jgi:hypothetical protein
MEGGDYEAVHLRQGHQEAKSAKSLFLALLASLHSWREKKRQCGKIKLCN